MKEVVKTPYYDDLTRISNSNIGIFLRKGARYLGDTLKGIQEGLKAKYLDKGSMVHMYLLQKDEFWDNYEILTFETPSSKQQLQFAEMYVDSTDLDDDRRILSAYQAAYSTKGKSDEKSLSEGLELRNKLDDYIKYLQIERTSNKKVISFSDLNQLKTIETNIRAHKKANELLYKQPETSNVYSEFHINWDFVDCDFSVACKSLIDRLVIDHTTKKITLIDLKTTVDVHNFEHSIEEFDYIRQLAYYSLAIESYFEVELGLKFSDYTIEYYIVAVQNNGTNNVRVIKFSQDDIYKKYKIIEDALREIEWHITTDQWDYPKSYYTGDGSEDYKVKTDIKCTKQTVQ